LMARLGARSAERGRYLLHRLRSLESRLVREVRGLGLMVGVELRVRVQPLLRMLEARGVLALQAGPTVLRLLPPLVVSDEEIDRAVDEIATVLFEYERSNGGERP
jgi:acetylornithine/LysW-gamma-L-lysine aminotransferase